MGTACESRGSVAVDAAGGDGVTTSIQPARAIHAPARLDSTPRGIAPPWGRRPGQRRGLMAVTADLPTPEQRRRDIARILAAGILRLRARAALAPAKSLEKPENSAANELEVSAKTVLSGHRD
jgi:hypothetical protein